MTDSNTKPFNFTIDTVEDNDVYKKLVEWSKTRRKSAKIRDAIRLLIRYEEQQKQANIGAIISKEISDVTNSNIQAHENANQESVPKNNTPKQKKNEESLDDNVFRKLMEGK